MRRKKRGYGALLNLTKLFTLSALFLLLGEVIPRIRIVSAFEGLALAGALLLCSAVTCTVRRELFTEKVT